MLKIEALTSILANVLSLDTCSVIGTVFFVLLTFTADMLEVKHYTLYSFLLGTLLTQFWASLCSYMEHVVGNKAKGRISKRLFQENKARQTLRKTSIFYPAPLHP